MYALYQTAMILSPLQIGEPPIQFQGFASLCSMHLTVGLIISFCALSQSAVVIFSSQYNPNGKGFCVAQYAYKYRKS